MGCYTKQDENLYKTSWEVIQNKLGSYTRWEVIQNKKGGYTKQDGRLYKKGWEVIQNKIGGYTKQDGKLYKTRYAMYV